jgi:hypothetical protein
MFWTSLAHRQRVHIFIQKWTAVHSLMMGQRGQKHVEVYILKHYCNCNEVCGFVGLHCNKLIRPVRF